MWNLTDIEITRSDDDLRIRDLTTGRADRISIDIKFVEPQLRILALESLIGRLDDGRIEKTDIANSARVVVDVLGGDILVLVIKERLGIDIAQAQGGSGRIDVVIDIRGFAGRFLRLDDESLNERGIADSGHDGHKRPESDRHNGKSPTPPPDIHDEENE